MNDSGISRAFSRVAAVLAMLLIVTLSGCGPKPIAADPGAAAAPGAGAPAPQPRLHPDEQRLIDGMEAHRKGRTADALAALGPLADHRNPQIAGRASGTLGLIYLQRGDFQRAITHLRPAAEKLDGDDAAQAYLHLGQAHQKLGRWAEARTWLSLAVSKAQDAGLREAAKRLLASTGYTLQLGAYSTKANADTQAVKMRSAADRAGVGTPRVVPSRGDSGQTLYLVQVGRFSTFDSAMSARGKLGRNDAIVVVMSE